MDRDHPAIRALALVLFLALMAGATALAYDNIEARGFPAQAALVIDNRTTAPGNAVSFPVLVSGVEEPTHVILSTTGTDVLDADAPASVTVPPGNGTGFWVEVQVAGDASPGIHEARVTLAAGGATRTLALPVTVEDPDEVVTEGDTVEAMYVGRFPDGALFATNVEAVDQSPLPRADRYASPSYTPIEVPTGPDAGFIEGFRTGIVGVGVGHDVTLTLSPDEAYGNETVRETESRTESIDREITQQRVFNLSRQALEQQGFINASSEEGDRIPVGEGDSRRVYVITFLNDTRVELTLDVEEGDRTTHHQQWPSSSVAVHVNETHVTYRVDPPYEEDGESFTWRDHWPNATQVVSVTDETITLRHSPEEGLEYTRTQQGRPVAHTVLEVTDDEIVIERENTAPLAGQTLVFDVKVLGLTSGS